MTQSPSPQYAGSTVNTPPPQIGSGLLCPFCEHAFHPGEIQKETFCPKCGRKFPLTGAIGETVAINGPEETVAQDRAGTSTHLPAQEAEREEDTSPRKEGMRFGDYDIISEIARGGMGVVYKARQRNLKRIVALKVLRAGEGASEEDLERFMREAKAAASLSHPNIVPIHELASHKGQQFFTMDYVEGRSLDQLIDAGELTPYTTVDFIRTIATAVDYAHSRGIIHRDLKPANIIIDMHGRPMITDFGLAVNMASDMHSHRMTRTGAVMGTIPYIPPEQAAGHVEDIDARSDVYSLGAVMYEMLTRRAPFEGETQFELLRRVIHQDPITPRQLNPKIHPDTETICLKCLEKDPARRYASASELAEDCTSFLQGEMIRARPATMGYKIKRFLARQRTPAILIGSIILLSLALVGLSQRTQNLSQQADKEKNEKILIKEKLAQTSREKEQTERQLQRQWRKEISVTFDRQPDPQRIHMARNPRQAVVRKGILYLHNNTETAETTGLIGIRQPLPHEFHLHCRVWAPKEKAGRLLLLADASPTFGKTGNTRIIKLGSATKPGASISKGEAVINESPKFQLTPETWNRVELMRVDNRLQVSVNGETTLECENLKQPFADDIPLLAIGVMDGSLQIDDIIFSVLGPSPTMINNSLGLADNYLLHGDAKFALSLYERVAQENASRENQIRAMRGYARSLTQTMGRNPNATDIKNNCDRLIETITRKRLLEHGEREYFLGLTFSQLNAAVYQNRAIQYFKSAETIAIPKNTLRRGPELFAGAFGIPEGDNGFSQPLAPELLPFDISHTFDGRTGPLNWTPTTPDRGEDGLYYFPVALPSAEDNIFFLRQSLSCDQPSAVEITVRGGAIASLWINGRKIHTAHKTGDQPHASFTLRPTLSPGDNTLLAKFLLRKESLGALLTVEPDIERTVGPYGWLARLESALAYLRLNNLPQTLKLFTAMQKDKTLLRLRSQCAKELSATESLPLVLETVDRLQKSGKDLATTWGLLEAMRELYPARSEDLAQRYYRLARLHIDAKHLDEADAALQQAIALADSWYLPRFERGHLFYRRLDGKRGKQEFMDSIKHLPESMELHLAIARFYLKPDIPDMAPDPALSSTTARRAIQISEQKNPEPLELCANALYLQDKYNEALECIEAALALEKTSERMALQQKIQNAIRLATPPPPTPPDAIGPAWYPGEFREQPATDDVQQVKE